MSLPSQIEVLIQGRRDSRPSPPPAPAPAATVAPVAPDLVEHRREEATSRLEALLGMWGVATVVFMVALLAVPPPPARHAPLLGLEAVGFLAVVVVAEGRRRLPRWTAEVLSWAFHLIIGVVVWAYGPQSAPLALFWLWFVAYAAWFLPWPRAAGQVVAVAVTYAVALNAAGGGPGAGLQWGLSVLTLIVVGTFVAVVRHRFDNLVERLAQTAATDRLTGLGNRHTFDELMEREFERARRANQSLTLVLGDLDGFKAVNDRYGHRAGDEVLRRMAAVLKEHCRAAEPPLRLGGDEFAFVLVATDAIAAHNFAERIRLAVRAEFGSDAIPVTISLGLACYPRHCPGLADLFRSADDAVYAAKREGRDCTVIGRAPASDLPLEALPDDLGAAEAALDE